MIVLIVVAAFLFTVNLVTCITCITEEENDRSNRLGFIVSFIGSGLLLIYIAIYDNNITSKKPIKPTINVICKDNICDTTYTYNKTKQ